MKITVSNAIAVGPPLVFGALVDPGVLRSSIPGCQTLTVIGPHAYEATLKIGVAGLKGIYQGTAAVLDRRPFESLTVTFDGKGKTGFVRGSAAITLSADGAGTLFVCDADVQVGGLIAAVGSRLVQAAARKLAAAFCRQLQKELGINEESVGEDALEPDDESETTD